MNYFTRYVLVILLSLFTSITSAAQQTILVTGGAGYIGSCTAFLMAQKGYRVIVLDNRDTPDPYTWATSIKGDIANVDLLADIFKQYPIDAIMHFAGYILVGESVQDPIKYYKNNVAKTITLLECMRVHGIKKFIFSSSAAVYGVPQTDLLLEDHKKVPINPYGNTKLMVEAILHDCCRSYGLQFVALRYFNAAGALPEQGLGERHDPESHVIPLLLRAALHNTSFKVFGADYPTSDGTCIRDYLHVRDIAEAHILALQHLDNGGASDCFNLGTGSGVSVREVVENVERIVGKKIKISYVDRRPGDPPMLVADATKAKRLLGWEPHYSDLNFIIKTAHDFMRNEEKL